MANSDVVTAVSKALSTDDVKAALHYIDPNLVLHVSIRNNDSVNGFVDFFERLRASFPDATFTVNVIFESGDLVADATTMVGTHSGTPFFGLEPTKQKVSVTSVTISKVLNGQITERWQTAAGWP